MQDCLVRVAVPTPLSRVFDYLLPDGWSCPEPGVRVLVPFGNRQLTGVVLGRTEKSDVPDARLRKLEQVLDTSPLLDS